MNSNLIVSRLRSIIKDSHTLRRYSLPTINAFVRVNYFFLSGNTYRRGRVVIDFQQMWLLEERPSLLPEYPASSDLQFRLAIADKSGGEGWFLSSYPLLFTGVFFSRMVPSSFHPDRRRNTWLSVPYCSFLRPMQVSRPKKNSYFR